MVKNYQYTRGYKLAKMGKGYRDGRPLGPIGGPCNECGGNIISIRMCTSAKGFETTSEKVCDTCGLVVPGSFQVLEPKEDYKTKYYQTHQDWLNDNKPDFDFDDTDMYFENYYNLYGGKNKGENIKFLNEFTRIPRRLMEATKRLEATNESKKMPMKEWRNKEYHEIADDYIHELGLNKLDAADVYYIIDNRGSEFDTRYQMEDIIHCICLAVRVGEHRDKDSVSLSKQKKGGLIYKYGSRKGYNKQLYSLIVQTLNS